MDFKFNLPSHIFALILIIFTLLAFIVLPILSYFGIPATSQIENIENLRESFRILFEIFFLIFQISLVIGLFIIVPFTWYIIVNGLTIPEVFSHLKLQTRGLDFAILWGVASAIAALVIIAAIGILISYLGFDLTEMSNIPDLELYFSLSSILFLVIFQPIGEEIFFRGFLLEKIDTLIGKKTAIISTAGLFGIAHLSFGNVYPAVITGIIGLLLAFIVFKTKNLYSAITAHVLFNIISFVAYTISKSI